MKRPRLTKTYIKEEIFDWGTKLKRERIEARRVDDLRKPLSSYDGRELLAHALWLMAKVRARLEDGARVADVRDDFSVARTILSFCARIPSGDLSAFE